MQTSMHHPTKAKAREGKAGEFCSAYSSLDIHDKDGSSVTIFWEPGEAQIIADAINAVLAARAPAGQEAA
jgi:hypothetical protein